MSQTVAELEPKVLWSHFADILATPRPSKHEERISQHIRQWAEGRGFEVRGDAVGNLVVVVPATPGHENAPVVILQGHMDMVCEKNSDVDFDFMTEGIRASATNDWVIAEGTTLGADNGIGVAAGMAIADDPSAVHGPLELLVTVDEETGLTGAMELDAGIVQGRIMVNLDTEEDGAVYIGCAGGADTTGALKTARRRGALGSLPVLIEIKGLKGGHSGLNIIENRGNAIKLLNRLIMAGIEAEPGLDIVRVDGGSKHNAIPRESSAVIRLPKSSYEAFEALVGRCAKDFREEFGAIEPDLTVDARIIDDAPEHQDVFNVHARDRLVRLVDSLPHGVLSMSREIPGLVETSSSLAVIATEGDEVSIITSHRSSVMPALFATQHAVSSTFRQAGAAVGHKDAYPGWKPNPESPVLQRTIATFENLFGSTPEVKAIHAGLECGLLIEKAPGLDCVSIGPQIENAHSPDEKVQISSVARFYDHLKALLADLA
jgi:dipeptidase D